MAKKVLVIGAGISGLSAACYLAREGFDVTVLEKNESTGGRASVFLENGFLFDRGPSWYWMPDVFESFFSDFGKKVSDFYHLKRLDPSYRVVFENDVLDIPAGLEALKRLFERMEPGAGKRLEIFMKQAEYKYQLGINKLVYKPGKSIWEFLDLDILKGVLRMDVLTGMRSHVRKFFYDSRLVRLMEFPVIFLGGHAGQIPALYSLMNYADTVLGTWYPLGGMGKIPEALVSLATSMEVKILTSREVKQIYVQNKKIKKLKTADSEWEADAIVGSADYFHLDHLLPAGYRAYSETYKNSCVMAPSCLLFYVGVNRKIPGLLHHTLFFDEDFESHINSIYESPEWPQRPLFYLSAPSVTDPFVAPSGKENLFLLIPVASGLNDISDEKKQCYLDFMIDKIEKVHGCEIKKHIILARSFSVSDFRSRYYAWKGNAYGLANTLRQTAWGKPSLCHPKIRNLFLCGHLTVPGPGVPPALISGKLAAQQIIKKFKPNSFLFV